MRCHSAALLGLLTGLPAIALGQPAAEAVVTSRWPCESCPEPRGLRGDFSVESVWVSDPSFKFGEYSGLHDDGAYLNADGHLRYWDERGGAWRLSALDLGLESRALQLQGARQGIYEVEFSYDVLPQYRFDSTRSALLGSGSADQRLPPDWLRAGSTRGMTALADGLREIDIRQRRETLGLRLELAAASPFDYSVEYRHEERDGRGLFGGGFAGISTLLVEPIDYTTDEIELAVGHAAERTRARLAYHGSFFSNQDLALAWQNPFTAVRPGADAGAAALPPDNSFQSVSLSLDHELQPQTLASVSVALGRGRQDDAFLAYTLNSLLPSPPLPRSSLDGAIDTTNIDARLVSTPTSRLRLSGSYAYDDRDNETEQRLYEFVESDAFPGGMRLNLPYSFQRYKLAAQADYRFGRRTRLYLGADQEVVRRDLQEVDRTEENVFWAKLRLLHLAYGDAILRLAHAERDGSGYRPAVEFGREQNPLMRKFNLADRQRDSAELRLSLTPLDWLQLGLSGELSDDDYNQSVLGLTAADSHGYTLDASFVLSEDASLYALYSREQIRADQAGSQGFGSPDWFARSEDVIETAAAGFTLRRIAERLDLGLDLSYADSTGDIALRSGAPIVPFPALTSRLYGAMLHATYRMRQRWALRAGIRYEHYRSEDWALDGVEPDTIANILTLGAQSHAYDVTVLMLAFTYDLGAELR